MAAKDVAREMLRKSGYKATMPRLAIIGVFRKTRRPLSVQRLIEALPFPMDQATAYRTVRSLKMTGILRQIDLRHNHAHYELADLEKHHHLVCIRCGRIEDVHHCNVEAMEGAILRGSKHFAEIRQHALEFYGVCKSCARIHKRADYEHAE
jgi:Fur family transcriptional regulator, ferric uptake regulator